MNVQTNLVDTVVKAYENGRILRDCPEAEPKQSPTLTPAEVAREVERDFWVALIEGSPA